MLGTPLLAPLALALAAGSGPAPVVSAQLPSGTGPAFRERMLAWSADAPPPATTTTVTVVRAEAVRASGKVGLPRLSSHFGLRSDPLRRTPRMHAGIDIPGRPGTPIRASADGVVRFAGSAGGYGRMVEIAHPGGLATRYAHLSQILVPPGAPVARGETIALMGSTGRSTGSHLHFEVRRHGLAADPLAFLGVAPPSQQTRRLWHVDDRPHVSQFARARAADKPASE